MLVVIANYCPGCGGQTGIPLASDRVRLKGAWYGRRPDTSGCSNSVHSMIMKGGKVVSDVTGADLEMALLIPVTTDSS